MIDLHPAGMTIEDWFDAIRRLNAEQKKERKARAREKKDDHATHLKREQRAALKRKRPAYMQKAFRRLFYRRAK